MPIKIGREAKININNKGRIKMVSDLGTNQPTGRTFYVSNTGSDSNNGTSPSTPWLTISKVRTSGTNGTIQPGDTIAFKRGDVFFTSNGYGGMTWFGTRRTGGTGQISGQAGKPITFTNYGDPNLPLPNILHPGTYINSGSPSQSTGARKILTFSGVDYITIDGLMFVDYRYNGNPDKITCSLTTGGVYCGSPIDLGDSSSDAADQCNNCIIRNCYVNSVGYGMIVCGNDNLVENNVLENFGQNYPYTDASYGQVGIEVRGKRAQILKNTIRGGWAWAETFSWNGGGIEVFNSNEDHFIAYNTIVDCAGGIEVGSLPNSGQLVQNITFAYNKFINCGSLIYANTSGQFPTPTSNIYLYNNVIIENGYSRFSGINFASGAASFPTYQSSSCPKLPEPSDDMVSYGSSTDPNPIFILKNNLFILQNAPITWNGFAATVINGNIVCNATRTYTPSIGLNRPRVIWSNNLYQTTNGALVGHSLGSGDISSVSPILTNTSNINPELWNFTPLPGSQLLNNGVNVGLTQDFNGNPIIGNPNIGILQN